MNGLLAGRRVLVTGVLTEASLASAVTRLALAQGADVLLTSPVCRAHRVTSRVAPRLGVDREVLPLDVELPSDLAALEGAVREAGWDRVDGVVHAIAYLPESPAEGFAAQPWDVAGSTLRAGAWSLAAVTGALRPLLGRGASVVALSRETSVAWPGLDWLGVAQGALESCARYLARDLGPAGVRVTCVQTGPHRTMLGRALDEDLAAWDAAAPLGWSGDPEPVARAVVALLSDWFPATTGSTVRVDGGRSAVSA